MSDRIACIISYRIVGGWCDFFVRKTDPLIGKSISIALALRACVRACVRAKLRERDVSSVARVGQTDLWGRGGEARPRLLGGESAKIPNFKSRPFQLQIGLLDFKKMGKAFTDVAPAGRLNVA